VPRPLIVLFLTIFVSLIGFGIIIPLLPFYAQTFGASPTTIGLLFAAFSLAQFVAAPLLGDLSDRWGRRPVLIFSLLGTVVSFAMLALAHSLVMLFAARIIDGLSGGNITAARAYIADITPPEDRAKRYGLIGAAFGMGFILGPALGGAFAHISYTAPIWLAALLALVAAALAWAWLPEPARHQAEIAPPWWKALPQLLGRPGLGRLLGVDWLYWSTFAVYQTTFALFGQHRFGWDAMHVGYILTLFGLLGVIIQVAVVGPLTHRVGDKWTLVAGLGCASIGLAGGAVAMRVPVFLVALVPAALGVGLCNPTLISLISKSVPPSEQGLVQGSAGALESLGRAIGPIWGNAVLEHLGEGTAYGAAALVLAMTMVLATRLRPPAHATEKMWSA
jgi:DHA1 family tetracycline resistance protein-like MFS transporter